MRNAIGGEASQLWGTAPTGQIHPIRWRSSMACTRGPSGRTAHVASAHLESCRRDLREVVASVTSIITAGAHHLAGFLGRVLSGIRYLSPIVFGVGCQAANEVASVAPPPAQEVRLGSDAPRAEDGPRQVGKFSITFYYVIGEDEVASRPGVAANTNRGSGGDEETELAAITPELVTLYAGGGKCEPIAEVSKEFASQLTIQGTGKLHDGRVLNIWGACSCRRTPCFQVTLARWGTAGTGRALQPFRTVAVDPKVVKLGSLLHVPLLEGRTMPGREPWGGYVHDGCVVADDTGGHIIGNRIDLFVGRKAYFLGLSGSGGRHSWARQVPVFDGTGICERKGRKVGRKAASI
jgi:3D (Asp-Asp-Asp) domain-containing protein